MEVISFKGSMYVEPSVARRVVVHGKVEIESGKTFLRVYINGELVVTIKQVKPFTKREIELGWRTLQNIRGKK